MNGGRVLWFNASSSYMLFEESGDSEAECVHATTGGAYDFELDGGGRADDDDAQSRSYESLPDCEESRDVDSEQGDLVAADIDCSGEYFCEGDDREDGCSDIEEEDGVVDQCLGGRMMPVGKDPAPEAMDALKLANKERESDRLFWESCLAS